MRKSELKKIIKECVREEAQRKIFIKRELNEAGGGEYQKAAEDASRAMDNLQDLSVRFDSWAKEVEGLDDKSEKSNIKKMEKHLRDFEKLFYGANQRLGISNYLHRVRYK